MRRWTGGVVSHPDCAASPTARAGSASHLIDSRLAAQPGRDRPDLQGRIQKVDRPNAPASRRTPRRWLRHCRSSPQAQWSRALPLAIPGPTGCQVGLLRLPPEEYRPRCAYQVDKHRRLRMWTSGHSTPVIASVASLGTRQGPRGHCAQSALTRPIAHKVRHWQTGRQRRGHCVNRERTLTCRWRRVPGRVAQA